LLHRQGIMHTTSALPHTMLLRVNYYSTNVDYLIINQYSYKNSFRMNLKYTSFTY